jgi:hypothetical protein
MKRFRLLFTTITAAAVAALTFSACEKTPDKPKESQPAQPAAPGSPAEPAKPGEPAKPAVSAPAPAVSPSEIAKLGGTYGFVAKLPKDVEGFSASYRMHDMWLAIANSKWAAALFEIPQIKDAPQFAQMREGWNSPQAAQVKDILAEVLGRETVVAMPAGFNKTLGPWVEFLGVYYRTIIEGYGSMMLSGGPNPQRMQQMMRDAAPRFIPHLAKCDMPPLLMAFKAGKIRPLVDDGTKQLKELVGGMPPLEMSEFKVGDSTFTSVSASAKKMMAQYQAVQIELQLKEALGDEKQAKAVIEAIDTKKFEIAWGWVGDYLVVSLGSDHSHLKLAAGDAESALSIPAVASRAAQFAGKTPYGLSYVSTPIFESFSMKFDFAEAFKTYAEELGGILKPEHIQAMVADVKRLEGQAKGLFATTHDPLVQVDFMEAGLRSEIFGGPRNKAVDSSKPLTLGGLATPATFLFFNGRTNAAHSKATLDFVETVGATVWGWYEKYGRTMVPESERQGAATIEALAIPLLKDFWKASRNLGNALGDEAAFVFDTAGVVPKIQDVPPWIAEGKMPRVAYVALVKDRAAVAEAWKGFSGIIKQLIALVPDGSAVPEPQSKVDGDVELHFVPLPIPTDDLLPHIAISKDRWILSTSPSLSKDLAAKPAVTSAQPLGAHMIMNLPALLDHVEAWLKVVDKHATEILPDAQAYQSARPVIDVALKLARCFQGMEVKNFDEAGQTRQSMHLKLQDLK